MFWREHHQEYPILSQIARDYLSVPATSAGVERIFNYGRDLCHYRRGSLKVTTISNLIIYISILRFKSELERASYTDESDLFDAEKVEYSDTEFNLTLISDDEDGQVGISSPIRLTPTDSALRV